MKANPFTSRVFQDGLEALPNSGGVEGRVLLCRGREHPAGLRLLVVFFQHSQQGWGQDDGTQGGFRLGRRHHQLAVSPVDLALDAKHPSFDVQIVPLEGQHLAPAQARGKLQKKQFIVSFFPCLDQKSLHFLSG